MSLRQLVKGLGRLSLQAAGAKLLAPSSINNCFGATQVGVYKYLSTSTCCLRKLDSRAHPRNEERGKTRDRWEERMPMNLKYEYTTKPLPLPNYGGRGPNGRIWNHKRGGGHKRRYRMVDWFRGGPESGLPKVEKVEQIKYDPNRTARLALVASGDSKRYIIATANMKPGDLIKSSQLLTVSAVAKAKEGDAYPVGSLPLGTLVNSVEAFPGQGGKIAVAAGTTAQLVRKVDDKVVVRMPSKREILVSEKCMATVGQVSNEEHNKKHMGKAGRKRWLGIRPRSGLWKRKTGRSGRKLKPIKSAIISKPKPVYKTFMPKEYYSF